MKKNDLDYSVCKYLQWGFHDLLCKILLIAKNILTYSVVQSCKNYIGLVSAFLVKF